jgi:hypothetical protein
MKKIPHTAVAVAGYEKMKICEKSGDYLEFLFFVQHPLF